MACSTQASIAVSVQAPLKKRATATSFAALRTQGSVPPVLPASSASARQRKV